MHRKIESTKTKHQERQQLHQEFTRRQTVAGLAVLESFLKRWDEKGWALKHAEESPQLLWHWYVTPAKLYETFFTLWDVGPNCK